MPKDIVICCDGTGNEINATTSNVLKLYRVLEQDEGQRVYYNPGVGTIGLQRAWGRLKQRTRSIFSLATGYGLDEDTLGAYRFLCTTYQSGDRIWLFGFSRGAYTVRVLAAFIHVIGLLRPDQINLAGYAFAAYKNASAGASRPALLPLLALDKAWDFSLAAGRRIIPIEFIGVWETVDSVIVPQPDKLLPLEDTQIYTRTNPSVKRFRQAMSIDERRRMFRLNRWVDPQRYRPDPFDASTAVAQDIRQVWFAGVHGDVGGGYREDQGGLSKFPLLWMIEHAKAAGLRIDQSMVNHLGWGQPRPGSKNIYAAPDPNAELHASLKGGWWILEWLPELAKWREWPHRRGFLGWYLPRGEPRLIPEGAILHRSVIERRDRDPTYRPINMPAAYSIEEMPLAPVADAAAGPASPAGQPQQAG